ncbi:hypothetical protein A3A14_00515 [Candidatus Daviesbacteria bacterium RIFCSPLOWO2_01_FULL_43_38]|uniref:Uncharacterized protein n=1 Tax=Candidatus Daviesbacteria bacterium RIFCSPHIGHO2_12_FULL_43_11 TaxID=1797780 RepID=A0A1F5K2I9_9BACT|nr:MAG: hypothetical protein A2874_01565 [Candidatus Daviesbacteria bacterium RIFCSPHIGHO2_01_FULL_43_17]OGE35096.1 MAG: hypothetical protein A3E45_03125 [Candidatus Daviesbacteria bacterium RIFCSPHIGHO2_12_FULL_43_11]OGE63726.1 MAG: hypothetical protein A3A14_00515 [Candidatus Daviesbacteria bacterium RIFCSPLOWO2_01_FULL_43_38]OGE70679.1 MAG: hypothetical protein A3J21_02770 [Candidatus Daviesbacteria bacterium RIFCSPLOWO2_02_FULL_43_11]
MGTNIWDCQIFLDCVQNCFTWIFTRGGCLHYLGRGVRIHVFIVAKICTGAALYLIVISGQVKMRIGDEIIELQTGNYVAIPNDTP